MAPPPLREHLNGADVVFVGVVTEVGNHDRTALVAVAEQWKGEPLGPQVVVHGGEDDPNAFSSGDRMYEAGVRYLVAAYVRGGRLEDNICSATQTWNADLARFRPADARIVNGQAETEPPSSGIPGQLLVIGGAVAALAAVGTLAFFRLPIRRGDRPA